MKRFGQKNIRRSVTMLFAAVLILSCAACSSTNSGSTGTDDEGVANGGTVIIGQYAPLVGEVSRYGVVLGQSLEVAEELTNNAGGIKAGSKSFTAAYKLYDNGFYEPSAQAKAVREAILQDGIDFSFGTYTEDVVKATAPFVTENKHLYIAWGIGYLSDEYPYVLSAISGPLAGSVGLNSYMIKELDAKRWAIMQEDSALGATLKKWDEASVRMNGLEPVYSQTYPTNTVDFMPIMSSILAKDPQVISLGAISGAQQALITEAAKELGYEGYFTSHEWWLNDIRERDPGLIEYLNEKAYFPVLDYTASGAPSAAREFYDAYVKKYGESEWESFAVYPYENFQMLKIGIEAAGSIDPTEVRDALLSMDTIDHPVYGKSTWWGKSMFGADYVLLTPAAISKVSNGKSAFIMAYDLYDDMEALVPYLK